MAENICGAFAMAYECGIEPESIIKSIANFHGLKRRLEKRGTVNGAIVFDDIAHSPTKAKSVLETLRRIYQGKIIAVFEPNTGNRRKEAERLYNDAFAAADEVVIPEYTKIKKGVASFMANGRALGLGNSVGFVKMLACEQTDRILGVHMVGPFVSELISEAVVAMEFMASSEDLARIIHAHPSLSEVTHEAALACDKRQLHG
jgi:hypothetical protein